MVSLLVDHFWLVVGLCSPLPFALCEALIAFTRWTVWK